MSTPAPISTSAPTMRKKVTTLTYRQKKERGEIITMLTAYDYPTAIAMDKAGVDSILVAVGGGGLIGGVASAVREKAGVIGVETEGTPTLHAARAAGHPVERHQTGGREYLARHRRRQLRSRRHRVDLGRLLPDG